MKAIKHAQDQDQQISVMREVALISAEQPDDTYTLDIPDTKTVVYTSGAAAIVIAFALVVIGWSIGGVQAAAHWWQMSGLDSEYEALVEQRETLIEEAGEYFVTDAPDLEDRTIDTETPKEQAQQWIDQEQKRVEALQEQAANLDQRVQEAKARYHDLKQKVENAGRFQKDLAERKLERFKDGVTDKLIQEAKKEGK